MKTITEFPGMNLKNAAKTRQDLMTSGKTLEELPQALGEALKLEGNKLTCLMDSLEIIDTKFEDLKRVVVFTLNEGEKAPQGLTQKGDHYFLVEYYPSLTPKKPTQDEQKGRSGKRDRKGKRGRNRGPKDDRRRQFSKEEQPSKSETKATLAPKVPDQTA